MSEGIKLIANNSSVLDKTTEGKAYSVVTVTELPAFGNRSFTIINDEGIYSMPVDTSFTESEE